MPKTYYHIPPEGGLESQSYYVVEVSESKGILYAGFLDAKTKTPLGYSGIFNPIMKPEFMNLKHFKYIKAIWKIDMSIPNNGKDITELNVVEMKINERIPNDHITTSYWISI